MIRVTIASWPYLVIISSWYYAIVMYNWWYLRWGVESPVEYESEPPHRAATVVARAVLVPCLPEINQSDVKSTGVRSGRNCFSVSGTFHDPNSIASN